MFFVPRRFLYNIIFLAVVNKTKDRVDCFTRWAIKNEETQYPLSLNNLLDGHVDGLADISNKSSFRSIICGLWGLDTRKTRRTYATVLVVSCSAGQLAVLVQKASVPWKLQQSNWWRAGLSY